MGKYLRIWKSLSLICTRGIQTHTRFWAFSEKTFWKICPFTYSHWQRSNAPPKRENISEWKTSSLIWTKGAEMHTHFRAFFKKFFEKIYLFTCSHWEVPNYRVFLKNFYLVKSPLTYLELQSQMTPYFTEKMRKCFFRLWVLYFCFPQKVSSLIPTENSQMHTLNRKKFYPFTYLELRGQNAPCFSEKWQKKFARLYWRAHFQY